MFIEPEKELDTLNQILKRHGGYIGDKKIKNVLLDKVCGDNVKDICSEKNEIFKEETYQQIY